MAFVFGSEDFRRISEDRRLREAATDRINTRKRALLDEQQRSRAPVVPTGRKEELIFNQVGPTAAEQEAAARQEALQRQQALELGAFGPVDDSGDRPGTDRGPTSPYVGVTPQPPSRVGTQQTPGITQRAELVDPDISRFMQFFSPGGGIHQFQSRLNKVERQLLEDTSGFSSIGIGLFGRKPAREALAERQKILQFFRQNKDFFRANPNEIIALEANPTEYIKSRMTGGLTPAAPAPVTPTPVTPAPVPAAPAPGVVTTTAPPPTAAPVLSAADRAMKHDAITYLESTNGTNIPKWTKKQTSSGVYGATDGTATGHGIQGVYVAKLQGLTPGSPEFNAEKDKAAASLFDHYLGLYPTDPARVAMSYRFGKSAGLPKNWDGSDAGIRARAKRVKGVDPDKAVNYVQTYVQRQSGGVATAPAPTAAPTAAPVSAAVPVTRTIIANNKNNPIEAKDQPIPTKGASLAKQLATKAPSKVKDLPFNMPFNFRAAELNTLLATREHLRRTAYITGGSPASAAYIQARADLTMNKDAIEHTSRMQALFMMQTHNDPRMWNELAAREFPGRNVRISPNSDGTFRVEGDGKIIGDRVNKVKLITGLRTSYSQAFHKRLEDAKVAAITKRDEKMAEAQILILGETLKGMNEVRKQQLILQGKMFTDDQGNTIGFDENNNRVLLEISEGKGLGEDSEPITTIRERRVIKTDPKGLTTSDAAKAAGVNSLLGSFFDSFIPK